MRLSLSMFILAVFLMNFCALLWAQGPLYGGLNMITGAQVAVQTGNVTFTVLAGDQCEIEFGQGWNLISICEPVSNNSILTVLDTVGSNVKFVLEWDDETQRFQAFSPLQASPPFDTFNLSKSYFVFYDDSSNATEDFGVATFSDTLIPLIQAYNSPTYPYEFPANITTYINPIQSDVNFVLIWNQTSQKFNVFSPIAANPEVTTIDRGDGQFILVSNPAGTTINYTRAELSDDL